MGVGMAARIIDIITTRSSVKFAFIRFIWENA